MPEHWLQDLDRMFIATNAKANRQRHLSRNPDRAFCRFEFLEALVVGQQCRPVASTLLMRWCFAACGRDEVCSKQTVP